MWYNNKVLKYYIKIEFNFKRGVFMEQRLSMSAIKNKYSKLTGKEKEAADYILAHGSEVVYMSIAELAEKSGVVRSAIIRLCKTLGYSGYAEFKLLLSKELAINEQMNYSPYISRDDNCSDIMDKIFAANIKTLKDTAAGLDRAVLDKAIQAIKHAEHIYIYGVGTSAGIVCDFQYRLMQLGYTAFSFSDVVNMKVSTLNITDRDVAVGISNSGRTVATVDALEEAKKRGTATICLTSYAHSKITKFSDYPLVTISDEIQYPMEAISARLAHISVLDTIIISLSSENYEETSKRMAKTHNLINTVRYREDKHEKKQ